MIYIAKELGISTAEVATKFTRAYIGDSSRVPIHVLEERLDGSCRLLRNGKCIVQKNKPAVCAIYPLGRMVVGNDEKYSYFKQPNDCPGECGGEQHTVGEWLSEFNLHQRDTESFPVWT